LQKKGVIGKADPYVIINLGEQTLRTKTVNNDQNPEWEFDFNFDITKDSPETLLLEVFDEDIGRDDKLGETTIELAEIVNITKITNQWIPLDKCKSGEVLISAAFHRSSQSQEPLEERPIIETTEKVVKVDIEEEEIQSIRPVEIVAYQKEAPLPKGCVYLTLHKARDLQKKGLFGKADPYVSVNLGDQVFKTKTINNNHNPEWNYNVTLDISEESPDQVILQVFDEDIGKDDELGITYVDLREVVSSMKFTDRWFSLEECKSGEILISAEFLTGEKIESQQPTAPEITDSSLPNLETVS
jgi:Ca2+-dependent lipid-binding protein